MNVSGFVSDSDVATQTEHMGASVAIPTTAEKPRWVDLTEDHCLWDERGQCRDQPACDKGHATDDASRRIFEQERCINSVDGLVSITMQDDFSVGTTSYPDGSFDAASASFGKTSSCAQRTLSDDQGSTPNGSTKNYQDGLKSQEDAPAPPSPPPPIPMSDQDKKNKKEKNAFHKEWLH